MKNDIGNGWGTALPAHSDEVLNFRNMDEARLWIEKRKLYREKKRSEESMKASEYLCFKCGIGKGKIYPEDEGPFCVVCQNCGEETLSWAYAREAWKSWKSLCSRSMGKMDREKRGVLQTDRD